VEALNRPVPAQPSARDDLWTALARDRVMAILRYRDGGDLQRAVDAVVDGGVRVLEITIDSPGALTAIAANAGRDGVLIGAGTVSTAEQVDRVADAGAAFVVSPGFAADVEAAAQRHGLGSLPGVATATEVIAAARAGVELFKLFPASGLGRDYLRQIRGPFGDQAFVPTGGVGLDDIPAWLSDGAFAVALGSSLAGRSAPANAADATALTSRAARAVELARAPRGEA
jgi:2-dehydro-3-deoxyphosphogluconate aldolase/(4S)-4-hydroxy-2-oxoglutarate aldolase